MNIFYKIDLTIAVCGAFHFLSCASYSPVSVLFFVDSLYFSDFVLITTLAVALPPTLLFSAPPSLAVESSSCATCGSLRTHAWISMSCCRSVT